jgi:hypothetical protein
MRQERYSKSGQRRSRNYDFSNTEDSISKASLGAISGHSFVRRENSSPRVSSCDNSDLGIIRPPCVERKARKSESIKKEALDSFFNGVEILTRNIPWPNSGTCTTATTAVDFEERHQLIHGGTQQLLKPGLNRRNEANAPRSTRIDRWQSKAAGEDMLDQVFNAMEAVGCSSVPQNVVNSERDALDTICERTEGIACSNNKCDESIFAIDTNMDKHSRVLVDALSAYRNYTANIAKKPNGDFLDFVCNREEPATCHGNNEQEGIQISERYPERDMLDIVCEGMEHEMCGIDQLDEARDDFPGLPRRKPISAGRISTKDIATISSPAFECKKDSRYGRHHQGDAPRDDYAKFPISKLFRQHDSSAPFSYAMSGNKASDNAVELPSRVAPEVEKIVPPSMRDTMVVKELDLLGNTLYWVPSGSTLCDSGSDLSFFQQHHG